MLLEILGGHGAFKDKRSALYSSMVLVHLIGHRNRREAVRPQCLRGTLSAHVLCPLWIKFDGSGAKASVAKADRYITQFQFQFQFQ